MECGPLGFAIGVPALDVLALVELDLSFTDPEQDLHLAIFPIERQRHQRIALHGGQVKEFADLGLVQKQLADRLGQMVLQVAKEILLDMSVMEENFAMLDAREGVANLAFPGAERLDLGPLEHDAGFKGIKNM